jgi:hypothetical protein
MDTTKLLVVFRNFANAHVNNLARPQGDIQVTRQIIVAASCNGKEFLKDGSRDYVLYRTAAFCVLLARL